MRCVCTCCVPPKPAASAPDLRGEGPTEAQPRSRDSGSFKSRDLGSRPGAHTVGPLAGGGWGGVGDEGIKPGVWVLPLGCEPAGRSTGRGCAPEVGSGVGLAQDGRPWGEQGDAG